MSKADDAVTDLAISVADAMLKSAHENDFPAIGVVAGAVTLGIAIGLATAIDDIAAARALLRVISTEIEQGYPNATEERVDASRLLRAAVS